MPDNAEPENPVLQLLRDMRSEMATKADVAQIHSSISGVRSEIQSLSADIASALATKIDALQKDLSEEIAGLGGALMEYHSSVVGHGMRISELYKRLRRVEQHLGIDEAK